MTACKSALDMYELLENILLYLPLSKILLAQKVARSWRDLTERSARLQQVLFRTPSTSDYFNPEQLPDPDPNQNMIKWYWMSEEDVVRKHGARLNPFLEGYMDVDRDQGITVWHYGIVVPSSPKGESRLETDELEALHRKEASWRAMLVVQPPTKELTFHCRHDDEKYFEVVKHEEGMRIGHVIDALRQHWFNCPTCPIWAAPQRRHGKDRWQSRGMDYVQETSLHTSGWDMLAMFH